MAELSKQRVPDDGGSLNLQAASGGGDTVYFQPRLKLLVSISEAAVAAVDITIPSELTKAPPGLDPGDKVENVAIGGIAIIPLSRAYRDPVTGEISISSSDPANTQYALLEDR